MTLLYKLSDQDELLKLFYEDQVITSVRNDEKSSWCKTLSGRRIVHILRPEPPVRRAFAINGTVSVLVTATYIGPCGLLYPADLLFDPCLQSLSSRLRLRCELAMPCGVRNPIVILFLFFSFFFFLPRQCARLLSLNCEYRSRLYRMTLLDSAA